MDQVDRSCGRLGLIRDIGSGAGLWLCSQITAEPNEGQGQRLTAKADPAVAPCVNANLSWCGCPTRSQPCEGPTDDPSRERVLHGPAAGARLLNLVTEPSSSARCSR